MPETIKLEPHWPGMRRWVANTAKTDRTTARQIADAMGREANCPACGQNVAELPKVERGHARLTGQSYHLIDGTPTYCVEDGDFCTECGGYIG